jgi:hypothetical protein
MIIRGRRRGLSKSVVVQCRVNCNFYLTRDMGISYMAESRRNLCVSLYSLFAIEMLYLRSLVHDGSTYLTAGPRW